MPRPIKIIISGVDQFTGKLAKTMQGIDKVGAKMRSIGKKMSLGLTVPIVGLGIASISMASSYQSSMERVRVLTGATTEQFAEMNKVASTIGKTTLFSSVKASEGMKLMIDTGFSLQDTMKGLPGVMKLATIANLDLGTAVSAVDDLTEGYGKNISHISQINDMLAVTARKGGLSVEALTQGMVSMSPVAQSMGISMEDMLATIGLLGTKGVSISRSLMGIKTAMASLVKPSSDAMEVFNKVGIKKGDLFTSEGKLRSLTDVFNTLTKAGISSNDIIKIFGSRAGPTMSVLLSGGTKSLQDFRRNLTGVTGTADALAKAMEETTEGRMKKFRANIESLGVTIGRVLLPAVNQILEKLNVWIDRFSGLNPSVLKTIIVIAGVAAAIGPLILGIGGLIGAVTQVVMVIKLLSSAMVFLATNPVGWIILAIGAVIAITILLIKNWDHVKKFFINVWGFISKIFQSKIGLILTAINPIVGLPLLIAANWEKVVSTFKSVMEWVGKVWDKFKGFAGISPDLTAKMGLVDQGGKAIPSGAGAIETARVGAQKQVVESQTKIIIDNKNDSKIRTQVDRGSLNLETYTGEILPVF